MIKVFETFFGFDNNKDIFGKEINLDSLSTIAQIMENYFSFRILLCTFVLDCIVTFFFLCYFVIYTNAYFWDIRIYRKTAYNSEVHM